MRELRFIFVEWIYQCVIYYVTTRTRFEVRSCTFLCNFSVPFLCTFLCIFGVASRAYAQGSCLLLQYFFSSSFSPSPSFALFSSSHSHSLFPVSTDTQAGIAGNELELFFFSRYAVWRFVFKNSGQQTFFLIGVAVKCKCCGRQFCNRQFLLRLVLTDRRLRLRFGLKLAVRAVFYIWFWQQKFRRFGGVGWRVARPFGCLDNNLNLLSE